MIGGSSNYTPQPGERDIPVPATIVKLDQALNRGVGGRRGHITLSELIRIDIRKSDRRHAEPPEELATPTERRRAVGNAKDRAISSRARAAYEPHNRVPIRLSPGNTFPQTAETGRYPSWNQTGGMLSNQAVSRLRPLTSCNLALHVGFTAV